MSNLLQCGLFHHVHPLSGSLLELSSLTYDQGVFQASRLIGAHDLNALGLLPIAAYSRFMEDTLAVAGYVLTGELVMPVRLEADKKELARLISGEGEADAALGQPGGELP